jgi:hypothetical protein
MDYGRGFDIKLISISASQKYLGETVYLPLAILINV